jgi:hypothetical protein
MATSKPTQKTSQVLPSCYHLKNPEYTGSIYIGGKIHQTPYFTTKEEAELELRCLEKKLSYELVETVEMEGMYPERATIMEEKYQASGRTNGLYTGLNMRDGQVSNDTAD